MNEETEFLPLTRTELTTDQQCGPKRLVDTALHYLDKFTNADYRIGELEVGINEMKCRNKSTLEVSKSLRRMGEKLLIEKQAVEARVAELRENKAVLVAMNNTLNRTLGESYKKRELLDAEKVVLKARVKELTEKLNDNEFGKAKLRAERAEARVEELEAERDQARKQQAKFHRRCQSLESGIMDKDVQGRHRARAAQRNFELGWLMAMNRPRFCGAEKAFDYVRGLEASNHSLCCDAEAANLLCADAKEDKRTLEAEVRRTQKIVVGQCKDINYLKDQNNDFRERIVRQKKSQSRVEGLEAEVEGLTKELARYRPSVPCTMGHDAACVCDGCLDKKNPDFIRRLKAEKDAAEEAEGGDDAKT